MGRRISLALYLSLCTLIGCSLFSSTSCQRGSLSGKKVVFRKYGNTKIFNPSETGSNTYNDFSTTHSTYKDFKKNYFLLFSMVWVCPQSFLQVADCCSPPLPKQPIEFLSLNFHCSIICRLFYSAKIVPLKFCSMICTIQLPV